ncbi:MAG: BRCT domain-containing protein, partial [Cyanobacteria bacterium P01_G01_bin.49]
GTLTSSPSSKTDYVVIGKAPGDKLKKAQKLGIAQLSEAQFLEVLEIAGVTLPKEE